jgi:E3 ubiquitin-protein ligase SHPRH
MQARALVKKAQLTQLVEGNTGRFVQALEFLTIAEKEVMTLLEEVRAAIAAHEAHGEIIKKETAAARLEQKGIVDDRMQGGNFPSASTTKTREQMSEGDQIAEDPVDRDEDYDIPDGQVGDAFKAKRSALSNRLRETQILMHQVKFWQGNITHNQNPDIISEVEKATYDAAETLRKDILKGMWYYCCRVANIF